MSPVAWNILSSAYENYLKTGDYYFMYQWENRNEFEDAIIGASQLYQDKYIDDVPDYVKPGYSSSFSIPAVIDFNLTDAGIEYMRIHWKAN